MHPEDELTLGPSRTCSI